MMRFFGIVGAVALLVVLSVSELRAAPGVLIEAESDTVTKFIYVGGSPNSTTHPAVSVEGKALGVKVLANNVTGAQAVVGQVAGYSLPGATANKAGVVAAGYYGASAKGSIYGVYGEASNVGVYGSGYGTGVQGIAAYYGVMGVTTDGYGIYGYADNPSGYAGYFDGDVYAAGDVIEGSDLALKENVRPLEKGLDVILSLEPKAYEMKRGVVKAKHNRKTKFGLIAQSVEAVLPELVREVKAAPELDQEGQPKSGERFTHKGVNYTAMIPVLIKAMQEQQALIEALQAEVAALRR